MISKLQNTLMLDALQNRFIGHKKAQPGFFVCREQLND
ncbi:hypothetical protein JCM19237_6401 [Photobacterium aphoticum]|uniref:Uncharacterized protein n=1 Tax=Photobacterium aphoticum TaxID=754436 RepID=A0A090R7C6_9GAMM|nr:hypothetical protein JCM19237_6401 [Photobacterium aphoticum]